MYSPQLLEHFQAPKNVGEIPNPTAVVEVENPVCGDILRLSVTVSTGVITAVRYKTRGCAASIAAGSALTEWMNGKRVEQLQSFTVEGLEDMLGGLPNESKHAARLCSDAVHAMIARVA